MGGADATLRRADRRQPAKNGEATGLASIPADFSLESGSRIRELHALPRLTLDWLQILEIPDGGSSLREKAVLLRVPQQEPECGSNMNGLILAANLLRKFLEDASLCLAK